LRAVKVFNSTLAFAVGDSGVIYRWNGASWSLYQDVGNADLYSVNIYNSTFAFATGSSGKIYRWNGSIWSENADLGSAIIYSVAFVNSSLVFVSDSGGDIYRWNGSIWSSTYSGSISLKSIVILNSTAGFSFGDSSAGVIIWDGVNWQKSFPDYLFQGTSATGLSCGDDDSCSTIGSLPALNANWSSCRAHEYLNATIHSIGFGPVSSCSLSSQTLQAIANCGNGSYYASSNATLLSQFYQQIAGDIVNLTYLQQTASAVGNIISELYPDSYIEVAGSSETSSFGLNLFLEKTFDNSTSGIFEIPENSTLVKAEVLSYSGPRWTSKILLNGNSVYDISALGSSFINLGDPFVFRLPNNLISNSNSLLLNTGFLVSNMSLEGSLSNKVIYQVVKNFTSFTGISSRAEGCIWNVSFFDGSSALISVPASYSGANRCTYNNLSSPAYNPNDAFQSSCLNLLSSMDFDSDGLIDVLLDSSELSVSSSEFSGIPYSWGTEVEVRAWD
jgi:hypothetical protein